MNIAIQYLKYALKMSEYTIIVIKSYWDGQGLDQKQAVSKMEMGGTINLKLKFK